MGYPSSGYRTSYARSHGVPGAFNPGTFGLPGGFGPLGNIPTAANDMGLPKAANDNFARSRRGLLGYAKSASRALPWLALGLSAWELYDFYNQMQMQGKRSWVDPAWGAPIANCGAAADTIRYQQGFPNCAPDQVISTGTGSMNTGPNKSFWLWQAYPLKYYINGHDILGQPGQAYNLFFFGETPVFYMPYAGYPLIDAFTMPYVGAMNPAQLPIGQFVPNPIAAPWGVASHITPNPNVPLSQQYQQGYSAPSPVPTAPGGEVVPVGELFPGARPGTVPTPGSSPSPGSSFEIYPNTGPVVNTHTARPPRRGEKEKKYHVGTGGAFVRRLFDAASETDDAVDAFFWAIPKSGDRPRGNYYRDASGRWRKSAPTLPEKVEFVIKHWRDIDVQKALENLARNQATDYVWGRAGRASRDAARKTHDQGLGSPSRGYQPTRLGGFRG